MRASHRRCSLGYAAVLAAALAAPLAAQPPAAAPAPVKLTAQQDHRRMLDLLGIQQIRPGANGSNPQAPNAANYDESKANPFPRLPDPLVLNNGKRVKNAKTWRSRRGPRSLSCSTVKSMAAFRRGRPRCTGKSRAPPRKTTAAFRW
jgi:hypothetical protein